MNTWKISNASNQSIKVACKTASMASKGIILEPGEFCISEAQLTASLDAQWRRNFINIDKDFDNSKLQLEFVKNYKENDLERMLKELSETTGDEKTEFQKAAENAQKYIDNNN
jgi:hypothetical protein